MSRGDILPTGGRQPVRSLLRLLLLAPLVVRGVGGASSPPPPTSRHRLAAHCPHRPAGTTWGETQSSENLEVQFDLAASTGLTYDVASDEHRVVAGADFELKVRVYYVQGSVERSNDYWMSSVCTNQEAQCCFAQVFKAVATDGAEDLAFVAIQGQAGLSAQGTSVTTAGRTTYALEDICGSCGASLVTGDNANFDKEMTCGSLEIVVVPGTTACATLPCPSAAPDPCVQRSSTSSRLFRSQAAGRSFKSLGVSSQPRWTTRSHCASRRWTSSATSSTAMTLLRSSLCPPARRFSPRLAFSMQGSARSRSRPL